nr:hypothetical protein [Desulfurococcales archaeon]
MDAVEEFIKYYKMGAQDRGSWASSLSHAVKSRLIRGSIGRIAYEYGYTGNTKVLENGIRQLLREGGITHSQAYTILEYVEQIPLLVKIYSENPDLADKETLSKARQAFFSRGWIKWEKLSSQLLGVKSMYDEYENSVMGIIRWNEETSIVLYNGRTYSLIKGSKGDEGLSVDALLQLIKPVIVISYGIDREDRVYGKTIDYKLLVKLAAPMMQSTDPRHVVERLYGVRIDGNLEEFIVDSALYLLDRLSRLPLGTVDLALPEGTPKLGRSLSFKPRHKPASKASLPAKRTPPGIYVRETPPTTMYPEAIIVTEDHDPLSPVFSPYGLILPDLEDRGDPWENYLVLQIHVTAIMHGWWYDPLLLPLGLEEYAGYRKAVNTLLKDKMIFKKTCKTPPKYIQVAPWNLSSLVSLCGSKIKGRQLIIDTIVNPLIVLLGGMGASRLEEDMVPSSLRNMKIDRYNGQLVIDGMKFYVREEFLKKITTIFPRIDVVAPRALLENTLNAVFEEDNVKDKRYSVELYGLTEFITGLHELSTAVN